MNDVRIHKLWPSWALLAGCVLLFVGERVYSAADSIRMGLAIAAGIAIAAAVVVRFTELSGANAEKKPVARYILMGTIGIVVALAEYAMIVKVFNGDSDYHQRWRGVLWALWPTVFLVSAAPLVAIEIAVAGVAYNPRYEVARLRAACFRGISFGLFTSALFFANYIANRNNDTIEMSAENTTKPGEETREAVRDLTKKVKVVLFYSRSNEVAETLNRYFEPLAALNENFEIERVDHALAADLAKDADVTDNGYVGLICDGAKDKIRVGTKATSARSALRRFDANFLKSLVKVTTQKKIAYIVTGHDERATATADKEDKRAKATIIKKQLEAWQFTVKNFGLNDGLASKIPTDGVLFIVGPEKPFLDAEIQTLLDATNKGARIFVALEAEREGDMLDGLLGPLGLKGDKRLLGHPRYNAPLTRTARDVMSIATNRYTSHESVTTMTRHARELATIFDKTGSLAQVEEGKLERVRSELVLKAMDDTFQDEDGDMKPGPNEKKDRFGLAAAVTRTSTTGKKDDESRVYVLADADVVSDEMIQVAQANIYLFRDAVAWLQRSKEPVVPTVTEKDVKLVHRGEEDSMIFLSTTIFIPSFVLLLGFFGTRRRRRS